MLAGLASRRALVRLAFALALASPLASARPLTTQRSSSQGSSAQGSSSQASSSQATPPRALDVSHDARALQPGEVVTLHVATVAPLRTVDAEAFGRRLPLWPDDQTGTRWTGLIGIDVETAPGPHAVAVRATTATGANLTATHPLEVTAKAFAERRLRVDPRFSDPPASARPRIAREAARLEAIFGAVSRTGAPDVPLAPLVPQPPSSPFGSRSFFNRQPRGRHNGVDFPSPSGTPIHAPGRGRVVLVDDLYFTGNTVVIDHGFGLYTLVAHLDRATAIEGREVARGDVLGVVGATGRATGPHLHWSVRLRGARVDPLALLSPSALPASPK
jgi:hypothetical protein